MSLTKTFHLHTSHSMSHAFPVVSITDEHDLTFHSFHLHPKVGDHVLGFRIGVSVFRVSGSTVWVSGSGVGFVEVGLPTFFTVKSHFGLSDSNEKKNPHSGPRTATGEGEPCDHRWPGTPKEKGRKTHWKHMNHGTSGSFPVYSLIRREGGGRDGCFCFFRERRIGGGRGRIEERVEWWGVCCVCCACVVREWESGRERERREEKGWGREGRRRKLEKGEKGGRWEGEQGFGPFMQLIQSTGQFHHCAERAMVTGV